MTPAAIRKAAWEVKEAVKRNQGVIWSYRRWQHWTREEIDKVATKAGVCYACDGVGYDLRFFDYP